MYVVIHHSSHGVLMLPVWQTTLNNAPPEDGRISGRNMQDIYSV